MFGTFFRGTKKMKPYGYKKGIPTRIELSFVKQAPVAMQLGCKFHGHTHIEIFMAHPIQINQISTSKRRCPCGGRAKVFVSIWLFTHKVVRHKKKNKPDLRLRSTIA
jgi:hypothetical protein